jgi:ATP-dependent RNA helicase DDX51/DBP6
MLMIFDLFFFVRLVSSDSMARGIDVETVETVVNYDVPVYLKTYIHRIGRTARAGRPGKAYTILRAAEVCE